VRVRVLEKVTAYWNHAVTEFEKGAELIGDLARHLADNAPDGSVEVIEDEPEPSPPPVAPEIQTPSGDEPPADGTIDELMTWVNGNPERAAQALAAEQAKDKPRSTVVKRLAALVDAE